ncbi:hypothetical protein Smp_102210 [Schistosoma mansoni]|nr:hypothetical protein Smp_102210 [Schistosoma mansoni]|eukprot:XP_018655623.1 hypothetical protein Smp_102210 [Schistosoma mansoni]
MKEVTLTGDELKCEALTRRLKWPTEIHVNDSQTIQNKQSCNRRSNLKSKNVIVTIEPGKIVTYILDYELLNENYHHHHIYSLFNFE